MARSYKRTSIVGNAAHSHRKSDAEFKIKASRRMRRRVRNAIRNEAEVMPHIREISNVYDSPKDGKKLIGGVVRK